LALGIADPMYVSEVVFDQKIGELHIHVDFKKGSSFSCSKCGENELSVYDTEKNHGGT
jgi:hypothetical protein